MKIAPAQAVMHWPTGVPLVALIEADGRSAVRRSSIVGVPASWTVRTLADLDPRAPFADIAELAAHAAEQRSAHQRGGGWFVALGYELGRLVEPTARALAQDGPPPEDDRAWPALALARVDHGYRCLDGAWTPFGEPPAFALPALPKGCSVEPFVSRTSQGAYEEAVARTVGYIRAGDIFQANITHRLSARWAGEPRALAARLFAQASPRFGAYAEIAAAGRGGRARTICSASPELFLSYDARTRRIETQPIKGTRPASAPAHALERSEKDAAELAMITDLMRNDLGRVAQLGSVRVESPRTIEQHAGDAGVQHASSAVSATLAPGRTLADLLGATFPPGSVTGAPKVRAMQLIDALEPVERGLYTGAIGWIDDSGDMTLSVAIRTCALTHDTPAAGTIDLSVGAGIVADSDPRSEWEETLTKARALVRALESPQHAREPISGAPRGVVSSG